MPRSLLFPLAVLLAAANIARAAYTLGATNVTEGSGPGIDRVRLEANPTADVWTATSHTNWLRIVAGGGSSNSDTVVFAFQLNSGPMRTGTLTIAGLTLTVRQQGAAAATTLAVTDVGTNSVTFHGTVTPNAGATESFFQYSTNGGWLVSTVRSGISEYCSSRSSLSRDSAGNFYICTPDCAQMYRVSATGGVSALPRPLQYAWGYGWRPISAIVDEDDNLFVAEFWCIRRYDVTTGEWSVFAGDPYFTQQNVDGTGTTARFHTILGMAKDSLGGFYAGCAYRIRHVTTNAVVTTLTDQGTNAGQRDGPAFGTSDIVAMIDVATGIAVDDYSGNLYWGEYTYDGIRGIRRLNLDGTGMVTTLAGAAAGFADGTGSVARFQYPMNVFVDKAGSLYVVDAAANNAIRKVTTNGVVTTLNCRDANTGSPVTFSALVGGMMEDDGNLLVIDHGRGRIARVGHGLFSPATVSGESGLTGTNALAVATTISNLFPGTTYYYWTVAANSTSTNQGEILSFTTLPATTALALTSDPNPSTYGIGVTFTATVLTNTPGWPPASGTVVFKDAGVAIGTGTLSGGAATFIINNLELGSHSITAEYAGDASYFGSTSSVPVTQTVNIGLPIVTVWPTASAIVYGQTLDSSTLSGGLATPTGTFAWASSDTAPDISTSVHEVVFIPMDTLRYVTTNGTVSVTVNKATPSVTAWPTATPINAGDPLSASVLGGASVTPAGSFAWISPTNRPHGGTAPQTVTFTPGDLARYLVITGTVSVAVNPAPTTNGLASSRSPSAEGESVTFSVTVAPVSSNCYVPAGSVTFKDGEATLGSRTLSGGAASLTTNGVGIGTHSISVEYPGNTDFLGATNSLLQTVDPALVVLRNPDTNAVAVAGTVLNTQQTVAAVFRVGTGRLRLARVALRLRCDFSTSPSNDSIRCTLYDVTTNGMPTNALAFCNSAMLTIAKSDMSWYTVVFSGTLRDYLLEAGRTYALGISIPTAGSSTDRTIKNITEWGTPYTMAPGYTFVQNARSITAAPNWSADQNRFGIILTGTEVPRTPTETHVSADVNPSTYGASVTFTATVAPESATGTLSFKDGGVSLGTASVNEGAAAFTTRILDVGQHDITAEYGGDVSREPSVSAPYVLTIAAPPLVTTLAATGMTNGVTTASATLNGSVAPQGLIADSFFRYATNAVWMVSTLAGTTNSGLADGVGSEARFNRPQSVAADDAGHVWVADAVNCSIRRLTSIGMVTTLAGTNVPWFFVDGTGAVARFTLPSGVAVKGTGDLYVADTYNHCIRRVTQAGVVTTLAGTNGGYADGVGSAAMFLRPSGIAVDGSGDLYVADTYNHCIRRVTPAGAVTTLAGVTNSGYADGFGREARFNGPCGVALDDAGNVYVADTSNHRIRRITPEGMVTTLAGVTNSGYADGLGSEARFYSPQGVAVDNAGNVYVADTLNHRIRKLANTLSDPVTTLAAQSGLIDAADIQATASDLQPGTAYYFQALAAASGTTNCGEVLSFIIRFGTSLTLDSGPNPATYGDSITFTSAVSPVVASGPVTFRDGPAAFGTGTLSGGIATFTAHSLNAGLHDITAEYAGNSAYGSSVSAPPYTQTVNRATPDVTTWPTAGDIVAGQPLSASTLTGGLAAVDGGFGWTTPAYGPPAGTRSESVTFTPADSGNYSNAVGSVTITVLGGRVETISRANGAVSFRLRGSSDDCYHVERTTSLAEPVAWTLLTSGSPLQLGPGGLAEFTDPNPPQAAEVIYRLLQAEQP